LLPADVLKRCERRTTATQTVRETEAEAIASPQRARNISFYHGNAALPIESLEKAQQTTSSYSAPSSRKRLFRKKDRERSERRRPNRDEDASLFREVCLGNAGCCRGGGLMQTLPAF
jgi:hypothetical protein